MRLQVESGTGVGFHPLHLYIDYLSYLYRKTPELSESEQLEANYRDILQSPLQPLMDNLESQTYEIFEKDAMKYQLYEDAIFQCLCDRNAEKDKETSKSPQVVVVVGAGTLVIPPPPPLSLGFYAQLSSHDFCLLELDRTRSSGSFRVASFGALWASHQIVRRGKEPQCNDYFTMPSRGRKLESAWFSRAHT